MLERDEEGKMKPAKFKVGSLIYTMFEGFTPGFTAERPYKVLKTHRCKGCEPFREDEVAIRDDNGVIRRVRVNFRNTKMPELTKYFPVWAVLPKTTK